MPNVDQQLSLWDVGWQNEWDDHGRAIVRARDKADALAAVRARLDLYGIDPQEIARSEFHAREIPLGGEPGIVSMTFPGAGD